jgi:chitin deacetylase
MVNTVLKSARPGGIVLLHDGGGDRTNTINALPQIIAKLKQQGYSFVTIPELLEMEEK